MKRTIAVIILSIFLLAGLAACGNAPAEKEAPGPVTVTLLVTMPDGTQNTHKITTDQATLGQALRDEGLIECDAAGFITTVEGVEASWEKDQAYWSFEIGGTYAPHGVDDELLAPGKVYALKYTKG